MVVMKLVGDLVVFVGEFLIIFFRVFGLIYVFFGFKECFVWDFNVMKMLWFWMDIIFFMVRGVIVDFDLFDFMWFFDEVIERLCELKGIGFWIV